MDLYIEKISNPHFTPLPPPNFKGTFAIFHPGYFIITPPSNL